MKRHSFARVWLLIAGLCGIATLAPASGGPHTDASPAGAAHPVLAVTTLAGTSFTLKAQRGKWVVVNYWATWCAPCIAEMPALSKFVSQHRHVIAIGLAYEDQPDGALRAFLAKHPVRYPIARVDPAHPPKGIAMPNVLPTTFLIAPDGHLARTFIGPLDIGKLAAAIGADAAGA